MNIAIVDDHLLFSQGLSGMLKDYDSNWNIEVFNNPTNAVQQIPSNFIDLLLVDINMTPLNGYDLISLFKKVKPRMKVIVVSVRHDAYSIEKAKELGAKGFVCKNESIEIFIDAINAVMNGDEFFLIKEEDSKGLFQFDNGVQVKLTNRELEVLTKLSQQLSTKEIANEMTITENTVVGYRKSLFQKFKVKNMIGLAKYAFEMGLY